MDIFKPKGIKKAVEILNQAESGKILVYYDPDPDGLYSGYFVTRFLETFGKKSIYHINSNREHGFKLAITEKFRGWTVIAVDFSITIEQMERLEKVGARVINIDHHDIEEKELFMTEHGVIINNQYCFEPERWRFLSGAGMVYSVLSNIFPAFDTPDTRAVVGLSLLSDVRVLESEEAKSFLIETYKNRSDLFKYLIQLTQNSRDYTFGDIYIDRNYADYVLHPKLNALFRMNMGMEAIHMILRDDETVGVNLTALKEQQNIIIDKILDNIDGIEYDNLVVKSVPSDIIPEGVYNYSITNFIGVACSRVKARGKTTFLYVRDKNTGECIRGSVRGCYDAVDYLNLFRKHGVECMGHHNAFGVLGYDINKVDTVGLEEELKQQELSHTEDYKNRVLKTSNLSVFIALKNKELAQYNIFVRECKRMYIQYTGDNWEKKQKGKMWEITIDGVVVKCFDKDLTPENAFILPILERGYIQYYLQKMSI